MSSGTGNPFIRRDLPRKAGSTFTYNLIPEGAHNGRIIGVVDLGFQRARDNTESEQLAIIVELAQRRPDGAPWVIAERFRFSLRSSSKLYQCLCRLVGAATVDQPDFDLSSITGRPCRIEVTHTYIKDKDRTYHNLDSIGKYVDETPLPPSVIKPFRWSVKQSGPIPPALDDSRLPLSFGRSLKDLAEDSRERRELRKTAVTDSEEENLDEETPF